jgi:hypothetical protein
MKNNIEHGHSLSISNGMKPLLICLCFVVVATLTSHANTCLAQPKNNGTQTTGENAQPAVDIQKLKAEIRQEIFEELKQQGVMGLPDRVGTIEGQIEKVKNIEQWNRESAKSASESKIFASQTESILIQVESLRQQIKDNRDEFLRLTDYMFKRADNVAIDAKNASDKAGNRAEQAAEDAKREASSAAAKAETKANDTVEKLQRMMLAIPGEISAATDNTGTAVKNIIGEGISTALSNAGVMMMIITLMIMVFLQVQQSRNNRV